MPVGDALTVVLAVWCGCIALRVARGLCPTLATWALWGLFALAALSILAGMRGKSRSEQNRGNQS